MTVNGVSIPQALIAEFCRRHRVHRLSLFGSVLTDRFTPQSDLDVLIEFEAGATPGLIAFAGLALELEAIFGRTVDLRMPEDLSPHFRDAAVRGSKLLHAA